MHLKRHRNEYQSLKGEKDNILLASDANYRSNSNTNLYLKLKIRHESFLLIQLSLSGLLLDQEEKVSYR